MTVYNQLKSIGDVLLTELRGNTKELATLVINNAVTLGQVLGRVLLGAAAAVTKVGNTGNGVFTLDATTPILAGAIVGTYVVKCITAATNSGTFQVLDPKGRSLGNIAVAATFANQIKFSIADGATDFVVGDEFDITIAPGSGQAAPLNLAATDGTQDAYAIAGEDKATSTAVQKLVVITRNGSVESSTLVWPGTITAAQKTAALLQLDARGIAVKTSI